MTIYRFQIRNIGCDLSEPILEAYDEFFKTSFLNAFILPELNEMIRKDLQLLIDTKTYEVIEDGDNNI